VFAHKASYNRLVRWARRLLDRDAIKRYVRKSGPAGCSMSVSMSVRMRSKMRIDLVSPIAFAVTFSITFLAAASVAQAQGDAARGEKKFEECASSILLNAGQRVGPNLAGLSSGKPVRLTTTAIRRAQASACPRRHAWPAPVSAIR